MEIDELKQYLRRTFIQGNRYMFNLRDADELLETAALRYRYFGERMLNIYRHNLSNCYFRTHTWLLLEMVNPDVASHTASIKRVLEGLLENPDTDLWNSAYEYYDYVGHSEFQPALSSWLEKHRNELVTLNYDIV